MGEVSSFALPPTPLHIDGCTFPAFVVPPESSSPSKSPLFLAGAGVRGMEIGGKFVKFTAIGVYVEESALASLAEKWSAKSADELAAAPDFFVDIINGPFEKFVQVTMILPLTGEQYSDKVSENCVAHWKAIGILTEAEVDAVNKFKQVFKPETFPPGSSIFFTHSPSGALSIAFSKDDSVPETNKMVIENKKLCRGVVESIIGEHGVSPATKHSMAIRFCEHFKSQSTANQEEVQVENPVAIDA